MTEIDKRIAAWQAIYQLVEREQATVRLALEARDGRGADLHRHEFYRLAQASGRAMAELLQAMGTCRSR